MKFIQIAIATNQILALDELGEVYSYTQSVDLGYFWLRLDGNKVTQKDLNALLNKYSVEAEALNPVEEAKPTTEPEESIKTQEGEQDAGEV